jgi:secreted PhoX family phosphatase
MDAMTEADDLLPADPARRRGLGATAAWMMLASLGAGRAQAGRTGTTPALAFTPVPMTVEAPLAVPPGYTARVLYAWGDATGQAAVPPWRSDAVPTPAEQALQAGMHHDGMAFFPLGGRGVLNGRHGLLALNHEYTDERLLHRDAASLAGGARTAEQVARSQAAHGVSVIEVQREGADAAWSVVRPSRRAWRVTANTPMVVAGPAAGHALLRTAADPEGRRILGTFANCAANATPWGSYLTCEENIQGYFEPPAELDASQRRWGLQAGGRGNWARWHLHDERFDLRRHPNEFHRFGWVVEIDPHDPTMTPVKRTALGRAVHEGAATGVSKDGRAVVFMGEDARFECIYRFVSRDRIRPGGFAANRDLLDHGTLSVARFDAQGRGRWLALTHGQGGLTPENGFADQGEVVIRTREASDRLGGTKMDRPEWTAISPVTGEVFVSLTNNAQRGKPGLPGADAANPRAPNPTGHILRWRHGGDLAAETFQWDIVALGGGETAGDAFSSPDGLTVDPFGRLWVATDAAPMLEAAPGERLWLPRNQLLACDPVAPGGPQMRRFLVAPPGCEVTGPVITPDGRTLFLNIQHPDPGWPAPGGRPRSATVVVTKDDGGVIGG